MKKKFAIAVVITSLVLSNIFTVLAKSNPYTWGWDKPHRNIEASIFIDDQTGEEYIVMYDNKSRNDGGIAIAITPRLGTVTK